MHRSISLGKSKFIATDFVPFVDFKDERSDIFVEVILKKIQSIYLHMGILMKNLNWVNLLIVLMN